MNEVEDARARMIALLVRQGVKDAGVLAAMRAVPRERFVDARLADRAYEDGPLPIGEGQTISQPLVVALMVEAARLRQGDRVLEVGAGSGYAAAVMSRIADRVYAIERHAALGETARERLKALGYDNAVMAVGDGSKGWPEVAPFAAIIVSAGGPSVPQALKEQLQTGGRLVIPVGANPRHQRLLRVTRTGADSFEEEDLGGVAFVPLIGEAGWPEDRRPG